MKRAAKWWFYLSVAATPLFLIAMLWLICVIDLIRLWRTR